MATNFNAEQVVAKLMSEAKLDLNGRKLRVCIEGNIGSGKTTLIHKLRQWGAIVAEEPVDKWTNIPLPNAKEWFVNESPDSQETVEFVNLLDLYYKNPQEYGFRFQMHVLLTMIERYKRYVEKENVIFFERSFLTTFEVFVPTLVDLEILQPLDYQLLRKVIDTFDLDRPNAHFDAIIYVNTPADTCMERIKKRNRIGEENIDLNFIKKLENYHDSYIGNMVLGCQPVLYLSGFETDDVLFNVINDFIKQF